MRILTIVNLLGVCCLMASTFSFADDAGTPPSKESEMNVEVRKQMEVRFRNLKAIAEDQERDGEERIDAILKMATLGLTNATDYLLENISLHIPKTHFRGDDDEMKQNPCFFVLKSKGEAVASDVLRFLGKDRNAADLAQVGKLLGTMMGTERAKQLLEKRKQQTAGDSESFVLRTNIDQVISVLSQQKK